MLAPKGTNLKKVDVSWAAAKKMMGYVDAFLQIAAEVRQGQLRRRRTRVRVPQAHGPAPTRPNPEFNFKYMKRKSSRPRRACATGSSTSASTTTSTSTSRPSASCSHEAEEKLNEANKKLAAVNAHVARSTRARPSCRAS